ncbi:MAG: SAM-dependent methyltransferase [Acetobacteraceae bacterium]|nr:SAM-dependent methyltransferase [Acetobacteraceae bacterium]
MERLDVFMARCNAQYYATHDPFRDFTTAPEISQVFGELLGAWAAVLWQAMGSPGRVTLAELGPGRGTLMQDALRTVAAVSPGFARALSLHLVETSPRLRAIQAERLSAQWHDSVASLPPGPIILIANEFLDALPIRQFVRKGDHWAERWVKDGQLVEQDAPAVPDRAAETEVLEVGEASEAVVAAVARRIVADGGAALFLDYGAAVGGGDTLQAIREARQTDPFSSPGEADLTAHVDFAALARIAAAGGAAVHGPVPQGLFLTRLGLHQRSYSLARGQPPARAGAILAAAERLVEPVHMGRLFKAMALTHPDLPVPPGFAA